MTSLAQEVINQALKDEGVHEQGGNNRGPRVEQMLRTVGLEPGQPWCCAAVCTWIKQAIIALGITTKVHFGASVLKLWERNEPLRISQPEPGCIALRHEGTNSKGQRVGHAMLVLDVLDDGQTLKCISGNTNGQGSREGNCVAIQDRPITQFANGYGFIRIE